MQPPRVTRRTAPIFTESATLLRRLRHEWVFLDGLFAPFNRRVWTFVRRPWLTLGAGYFARNDVSDEVLVAGRICNAFSR